MTEYYVSGVIEIEGTCGRETDEDAEFFTLYGKDDQGLSQCIADFTDRLSAEAVMQVYQERDALQQQVNALAAESLYFKDAIVEHSQCTHFCEACGEDDPCANDDVCWALNNETPATDAIRNQWMADGAMKVADSLLRMVSVAAKRDKETILSLSRKAEAIAEQLRQPEEKGQ